MVFTAVSGIFPQIAYSSAGGDSFERTEIMEQEKNCG
jgi:hypothetical protein